MSLKKSFLNFCDKNNFEKNESQIKTINELSVFYEENFKKNFLDFFKKRDVKLGFYLVGDVGVGKTMILNFFFENLSEKKMRMHFNEFMINFHDFIFKNKNKDDGIGNFVKDLSKKTKILYFDEFQVTNIVDAMILGKLFERIFEEKINVIFSSNITIGDLYKDGLQREQFLPFIKILKKNVHEKELLISTDYRTNKNRDLDRFLSPLNQSTNFLFNKFFRKITKNKKKSAKTIEIKGRKLNISEFYSGVSKFHFNELFDKNLGAEDYIRIADLSNFIFIENLPDFNNENSNQQQRFITFVDIVYEKKIPLMITSKVNLKSLSSSQSLKESFKRTISRIYELTSSSLDKL